MLFYLLGFMFAICYSLQTDEGFWQGGIEGRLSIAYLIGACLAWPVLAGLYIIIQRRQLIGLFQEMFELPRELETEGIEEMADYRVGFQPTEEDIPF